jgi:hypothetical protein
MCEVTIRCEGDEFLALTLLGRSHPTATDYWDGNWISTSVEVQAGGFRGSVVGHLRAEELADFHDQFARLQLSLKGSAECATMEGWLRILVEGNGRGQLECRCAIRDDPGIGNTLNCILSTDQTFTRTTVSELAAAVREFPVIGKPDRVLP